MENYENEYVSSWVEDGIIQIVYKKGSIITLDVAKFLVAERLKRQNDQEFPGLAYFGHINTITPEARKYLGIEGYRGMTKVALVTTNPLKVIIGNMFISFDKPAKPTRLFKTKEEAVKWLKE